MTKTLILFDTIRDFLSKNITFSTNTFCTVINPTSYSSGRKYLAMLTKVGFIERVDTSSYKRLSEIPFTYHHSTLVNRYKSILASEASKKVQPESDITQRGSVFENMKLFFAILSQKDCLDEVFTLDDIRAFIYKKEKNNAKAECQITYYLTMLKGTGYINNISKGTYEVLKTVPMSLKSTELRDAWETSRIKNTYKSTYEGPELFVNLKAYLLDLQEQDDKIFTLQQLREIINPNNDAAINGRISNYLSALKNTGYIVRYGVKSYELIKNIPYRLTSTMRVNSL